jgi:ribosomal protein L37E
LLTEKLIDDNLPHVANKKAITATIACSKCEKRYHYRKAECPHCGTTNPRRLTVEVSAERHFELMESAQTWVTAMGGSQAVDALFSKLDALKEQFGTLENARLYIDRAKG